MKQSLSFFILVLTIFTINAQELNCKVKVISSQIQGVNPRIFETMETALVEFMNSRKWTNEMFDIEERIDCNIQITLSENSSNTRFSGSIQVQSSRPIYNSNYNSTVVNLVDNDFTISFQENTRLEFSKDIHRTNLTAILAFYAYYIIGMDYDTYSLEGGTPFFQVAQNIVSNAQNANESGWKAVEGNRNRYWLIDNQLHQTFKPLRECLYEYHLKGFDGMQKDIVGARKKVAESIKKLKKVHSIKPSSYNVMIFFLAKSDELISLFSKSDSQEKNAVVMNLKILDPGNIAKYEQLRRGK